MGIIRTIPSARTKIVGNKFPETGRGAGVLVGVTARVGDTNG